VVEYPRPIQLGPRIYGLGMRQLVYLSVTVSIGGLFALGVFTPGLPFLLRGLLGLGCVVVGVCLAFLKIGGLYLDRLLGTALRFLLRPRQLVWRKEGERAVSILSDGLQFVPEAPPVALALRRAESAPLGAVVFALNAAVACILLATTLHMAGGGLVELRRWLQQARY